MKLIDQLSKLSLDKLRGMAKYLALTTPKQGVLFPALTKSTTELDEVRRLNVIEEIAMLILEEKLLAEQQQRPEIEVLNDHQIEPKSGASSGQKRQMRKAENFSSALAVHTLKPVDLSLDNGTTNAS